MKATLADIMKVLPDFDDLERVADEISDLLYRKLVLDKDIKAKEAEIFRVCTTNPEYFLDGKPRPVSFIDNAYRYTGINGELLPMRSELALVTSQLEKARIRLDVYKNMMDIWRTLSANERSSAL